MKAAATSSAGKIQNPSLSLRRRLGPLLREERRLEGEALSLLAKCLSIMKERMDIFEEQLRLQKCLYLDRNNVHDKKQQQGMRRALKKLERKVEEKVREGNEAVGKANAANSAKDRVTERIQSVEDRFWKSLY